MQKSCQSSRVLDYQACGPLREKALLTAVIQMAVRLRQADPSWTTRAIESDLLKAGCDVSSLQDLREEWTSQDEEGNARGSAIKLN